MKEYSNNLKTIPMERVLTRVVWVDDGNGNYRARLARVYPATIKPPEPPVVADPPEPPAPTEPPVLTDLLCPTEHPTLTDSSTESPVDLSVVAHGSIIRKTKEFLSHVILNMGNSPTALMRDVLTETMGKGEEELMDEEMERVRRRRSFERTASSYDNTTKVLINRAKALDESLSLFVNRLAKYCTLHDHVTKERERRAPLQACGKKRIGFKSVRK